ncbi:MAG: bifunctional DNA-formamidopyrimidine glycosylase/DNA-(apurinic or apyrimidinic site) lyase [Bdellovibrionales bacterium]|nr:bifunctional DNA-formamidopyrimidine glycosylase/DNA-(apurinic or apyrimidinic site) lyase [Bdellovibrionales bacterium]
MPELPEVETVKRGLNELLKKHEAKIIGLKTSKEALRFPYPKGLKNQLENKKITSIDRRAKYLLFMIGDGPTLVSHLGMTGNWRELQPGENQFLKHDHFRLLLESGHQWIYNDSRRFGFLDIVDPVDLKTSKWFHHLGPEPTTSKEFDENYLFAKTRKKQAPIKNVIMDQTIVVGVGNIYASEALFLAGVDPKKLAGKVSKEECRKIVVSISKVLKAAIRLGGTTIRDFKSAGGSEGYFAQNLQVYGRKGESCFQCHTTIQKSVLAGRATYWCKKCQK